MTKLDRIKESLHKNGKTIYLPIGIALFGVLLLFKEVQSFKEKYEIGQDVREVLTVSRSFQQGEVIEDEDLSLIKLPSKNIPLGTLEAQDKGSVVGKRAIRPLSKNELLLWSSLDTNNSGSGPAGKIAPGYRSLSIQVDSVSSVGQAIRPGDRVDLTATISADGTEGARTFTLLQNVTVIETGEAGIDSEGRSYSTVSLMVLPKEVNLLMYSQQHGRLSFVLRNPEDHKIETDLPMVGLGEVIESGFRNSIQKERDDQVEIIRGGKLSLHDLITP